MQLRVDPHGRTYSALTDHPFQEDHPEEEDPVKTAQDLRVRNTNEETEDEGTEDNVGVVLPLSRKHLEMFTRMSAPSFRTTIRTDTVSTTLEQDTDVDCDNLEDAGEDKSLLEFYYHTLCFYF